MVKAVGNREANVDKAWADGLRQRHRERTVGAGAKKGPLTGADGKIHPRAIFDAIAEVAARDYIAIADGGDLLSFARTGLAAITYMDAGAFGCLGVGVPYAVAAALAFPGRQVISVNGDGAFGIMRWKSTRRCDTAPRLCSSC